MKTYYANFSVNNGTTLMRPISDTNKARLIKNIKEWASGEIFHYGKGDIVIRDEDGREIDYFYAGWIYSNSCRNFVCRWYRGK